VKAGFLWMAFDRSRKAGPYDRLYIDSNANGSLADETAQKPNTSYEFGGSFAPVKVLLTGDDGPVTYHLNISIRAMQTEVRFRGGGSTEKVDGYALPAGWYEGVITLGGKKYRCQLVDYNVNGAFNDTSTDIAQMDRICLGPVDGATEATGRYSSMSLDERYAGKYLPMDDAIYVMDIARDGAFVKFTPAGKVSMGNVRVSSEVSTVSLAGPNGLFRPQLKEGIGQVPLGKYRVSRWVVERKDKSGKTWKMQGESFPDASVTEVQAEAAATLATGEPVVATIERSGSGREHTFQQVVKGQLGERVSFTCDGGQPPAPKLRITNADGSYNKTFQFEYG